jgi:plasmid stability protein
MDDAAAAWIHNGSMQTVTLSVKNVPRDLARRLRARAERNHRSLQGELLAILTDAADVTSIGELAALVDRLGLKTGPDSARFIREDRDGRRR